MSAHMCFPGNILRLCIHEVSIHVTRKHNGNGNWNGNVNVYIVLCHVSFSLSQCSCSGRTLSTLPYKLPAGESV